MNVSFIKQFIARKPDSYMKHFLLLNLARLYHQRAIELYADIVNDRKADRNILADAKSSLKALGGTYAIKEQDGGVELDAKLAEFRGSIHDPVKWRTLWGEIRALLAKEKEGGLQPKANQRVPQLSPTPIPQPAQTPEPKDGKKETATGD